MGEHFVEESSDEGRVRAFTRALLNDLAALERMLDDGRIESGARRLGGEIRSPRWGIIHRLA